MHRVEVLGEEPPVPLLHRVNDSLVLGLHEASAIGPEVDDVVLPPLPVVHESPQLLLVALAVVCLVLEVGILVRLLWAGQLSTM